MAKTSTSQRKKRTLALRRSAELRFGKVRRKSPVHGDLPRLSTPIACITR
jgi:hypothetical protein